MKKTTLNRIMLRRPIRGDYHNEGDFSEANRLYIEEISSILLAENRERTRLDARVEILDKLIDRIERDDSDDISIIGEITLDHLDLWR
tara:strand:+ start:536 stop:799 length:264 start_codon:yes stop_codon:yes gene_type:complete